MRSATWSKYPPARSVRAPRSGCTWRYAPREWISAKPQDPLVGHRVRGAQLLGKVADPQFLDHPADPLQLRPVADLVASLPVSLRYGLDPMHPVPIAVRIAGQLVQPALDGLQVTSEVRQPRCAGRGDEAGPDQGGQLSADVGHCRCQ